MGTDPVEPQRALIPNAPELDELPIQTVMAMARRLEGELSDMVAQLATEQEQLEGLDIEEVTETELAKLNDRLIAISTRFDEVTHVLETLQGHLKERLARPESH